MRFPIGNKHKGSNFDDFLEEEGLLDKVQAVAVKRVIAHQIRQAMKKKDLTKTKMVACPWYLRQRKKE